MKQLTEEQIENFKRIAAKTLSIDNCGDEWNIAEISGGSFDNAYHIGFQDAAIEYARFILDAFGIKY